VVYLSAGLFVICLLWSIDIQGGMFGLSNKIKDTLPFATQYLYGRGHYLILL